MPDDLKYGPQRYVSESNPEWDARQYLPEDPTLPPEKDAPLPAAHPLDLHHLSQQTFAHDEEAKKRWFLTAFVAPEDQHLLDPPADTRIATAALNAIKQALEAPARECTDASLHALRQKILALFQQDKWLGVALQMVDNKALSIDMLNTLIQWQALKIQFGEKFFSLNTDATTGINQPTVQHIVFAQAQLTLDDIQKSAWGKIIARHMIERRAKDGFVWEPTLENFNNAVISAHTTLTPDKEALCIKAPSTLLEAYYLVTHKRPSLILPLYSFGFLAFEDFCAAAFLGGRPMQAYLPGARGNLYWAHGSYYGEALVVQHDYVHAYSYSGPDKTVFQQEMKMYAIIANALVRTGHDDAIKTANHIIDTNSITYLTFDLLAIWNNELTAEQLLLQRKKILTAIYNEFALASGITLSFSCTQDSENKHLFHLRAIHQEQALSFTVDLSTDPINEKSKYLEDFMKAFEQIPSLSTIQIQQQQQQQQQRPRWSPTIMLWTMRAAVFSALVGVAFLIPGLLGVLNNPIVAGILLPIIGIASALVSKWAISPGLVGQGDDIGDVYFETHRVNPPTLINNDNVNNVQPKPGYFMRYLPCVPKKGHQPPIASLLSVSIRQ